LSESDKAFVGSIPEIYDTYLVPLIFEEFASDLAERLATLEPAKILETAAGSGVVARALGSHLSAEAHYTVTDLNQPMLDHAASQHESDPRVCWQQADALNLPFDDESFDPVICQFGVMFYPDRVAGYTEAFRVLKPGGTLLFNVWGPIGSNEFADISAKVIAAVFPDEPTSFLSRTPYTYHEEDLIRQELSQAGFSNVTYETLESMSSAPSPRHAAIAFCQGTPQRIEIETWDASQLDHVTDRVEEVIESNFGAGPVSAKIKGHIITAMR
jgi:ubiquinone/menaquinone biosynthesis C-methylase UbiE